MNVHEVLCPGAGVNHKVGRLPCAQAEVSLYELQHLVEFAFVEHVIGTRDIDHQHGRGQSQHSLTVLNGNPVG
ncbi:MAG: hypothetical protein P8X81_03115 [Woeseiaceae bacterium]